MDERGEMKYRGLHILFALGLILFTCCQGRRKPPDIIIPPSTGVNTVKKFTLKNSMPVLILEEPDNRIVTLDVWVNTGSVNEPNEINGVSHFLEHMLFKGTETRGVGEVDSIIESVGGLWNAGTSMEFTHYYLTLATPFTSIGIDMLSDVLANSSLDPAEVEKERQVILEEYFRKEDNPSQFLATKAFNQSFEKSPYKFPVLGTPETINAITPEKLRDYYISRYAPENMVLVIAGGVNAEEILPVLEEKFGSLERSFDPGSNKPETGSIRRTGVSREFEKPVKEAYLLITLPAPDFSVAQEVYAYDLLSYILGEGRSSRFYSVVKEKKHLVSSISAYYPTHRSDGMFFIFATLDYSRKEEVLEAILVEISQIIEKPVEPEELQKAKRMLTNHCIFSQETTSGRTSEIGFYYTLTGSTEFQETYLEEIRKITPEDVKSVAQKYLDPKQANIFIVRPEK